MPFAIGGKAAINPTRESQPGLEVDNRDVEGGMHTRPGPEDSPMIPVPVSEYQSSSQTASDNAKEDKPYYASAPDPPQKQRRLPFGLTPLVFGLLAALVGFLVGGGLGGGIGAGLSNKSSTAVTTCPASSTDTPTPASGTSASSSTPSSNPGEFVYSLPVNNFTVPPYYNVSSTYSSCPNTTPSPYTDQHYQSYEFLCGTVYAPGQPADPKYGHVIGDLASALAYSIEDCTLMCTLWNTNPSIPHVKVCRGVSWSPDIKAAFNKFGSNCVLKNATGPGDRYTKPYIVSAKLVSAV